MNGKKWEIQTASICFSLFNCSFSFFFFFLSFVSCDIYKWLDILVFSDKDGKPQVPSHSSFTILILVGYKRTHTTVRKEQEAQIPVLQYNLPWAGQVMKGLIAIWTLVLFHSLSPWRISIKQVFQLLNGQIKQSKRLRRLQRKILILCCIIVLLCPIVKIHFPGVYL